MQLTTLRPHRTVPAIEAHSPDVTSTSADVRIMCVSRLWPPLTTTQTTTTTTTTTKTTTTNITSKSRQHIVIVLPSSIPQPNCLWRWRSIFSNSAFRHSDSLWREQNRHGFRAPLKQRFWGLLVWAKRVYYRWAILYDTSSLWFECICVR